jgi:hypothetical protein
MSKLPPLGLDLSDLPPEVRQKVEYGLAKLSPEVRKQWLEKGSPLLERLVAGASVAAGNPPPLPAKPGAARQAATAARAAARDDASAPVHNHRSAPHGHYNDTIRPGDRAGGTRWILIALAIAGGLVVYLR